jgi:hypothetical protein
VKKILEFLGDFLLKILFIGAITFFIWHACMPEYKFYFVFFVIITFLTVIPIKINLPKIAIKNEKISKIIPKIKKILIMVLAGVLAFVLLFSIIGSFVLGWKIWLILLGIELIYWFITEIML